MGNQIETGKQVVLTFIHNTKANKDGQKEKRIKRQERESRPTGITQETVVRYRSISLNAKPKKDLHNEDIQ